MSNAEQVVRQFFDRVSGTDFDKNRALFAESITEDCEWANTGFPTAQGREACLATWDAFHQGSGFTGLTVDWIAAATAEDGVTVLTERVDHLHDANGKNLLSIPLAGTLVVRDQKIAAWRDYWDPRPALG